MKSERRWGAGRRGRPGAALAALLCGGLLLSGAMGPAHAEAIDDAVRCLEEEARTEGRRASLLSEAESLGVRIEAAQATRSRDLQKLLRRAERLDREGQDLELELVLQRAACRERAIPALAWCKARLAVLERDLAAGGGRTEDAAELLRLRTLRSRLETFLGGPVLLGYPLIPPDSTDTPEILAEKLNYHEQVIAALAALEERVRARRAEVAGERRSLEEAARFLRDLDFLDEGGRVSPSGSVRFRGAPPDNGAPDTMRRAFGSADLGGSGGNLGRILETSPTSPEDSDRILRLLDGYLRAIDGELQAVTTAAGEIRRRLEGGTRAPQE